MKKDIYHFWGDDWFKKNGKDFYKAVTKLEKGFYKYRVRLLDSKEKFGTYRCDLGCLWRGTISELFNPYTPNYTLLDQIASYIFKKIGLVEKVNSWQKQKINQLFQEVCKEYPDFTEELIADIDFKIAEWIKPGKYGDIDGVAIQNNYWK